MFALVLHYFITSLCDWLTRLVPLSQPMKCRQIQIESWFVCLLFSVIILSDVRTKANRVAVKVTVLSGYSGIFILIRRWREKQQQKTFKYRHGTTSSQIKEIWNPFCAYRLRQEGAYTFGFCSMKQSQAMCYTSIEVFFLLAPILERGTKFPEENTAEDRTQVWASLQINDSKLRARELVFFRFILVSWVTGTRFV